MPGGTYWLVAAPIWFLQRTRQYCRRLRAEDTAESARSAAEPEGKTVLIQGTGVHDTIEGLRKTA